MVVILNSLCFVFILFWVLSPAFFNKTTRFSSFSKMVSFYLKQVFSYKVSFWVVYLLFFFLIFTNLSGNIPLSSIPTLFYSQTLSVSLLFWVPTMICVFASQFKSFMAHMLPYGSPSGLMLILPLVEIFSQLIRPFTLMIRISTNLSSGHIMLYMFSYFTLLSDALSTVIYPTITILLVLEICISMLQAYIFVTLITLYLAETI